MRKVVSAAAAGLLAVALAAPAFADCGIKHTADSSKPADTTMTPKPKAGS
jgi:hypothetical protein